ncbi:hypothetical protein MTO96_048774 [Rhipicephalus appendiculatus]
MKLSSALLCALLFAFLALPTDAESSKEVEGRHLNVGGCPNVKVCEANCRKSNYIHGHCIPKLMICVCV